MTNKREISTDKFGKVYLRYPTPEESRKADWQYSKAFNEALVEGMMTQKQMEDLMEERNIWTEKDEKELDKLRNKIEEQYEKLSKAKSRKQRNNIKNKINEIRRKFMDKQGYKQQLLSNTVEMKADEARLNYLIFCCAENENEQRIWSFYEDFQNERDQESTTTIIYEFLAFINDIDINDLADNLVEQEEDEDIEEQSSEEESGESKEKPESQDVKEPEVENGGDSNDSEQKQ